jgi:transcription elongation GreA/GreB family factor
MLTNVRYLDDPDNPEEKILHLLGPADTVILSVAERENGNGMIQNKLLLSNEQIISFLSPIGSALLGKKVGDLVTASNTEVTIRDIRTSRFTFDL